VRYYVEQNRNLENLKELAELLDVDGRTYT
jgi:hypothetical protein